MTRNSQDLLCHLFYLKHKATSQYNQENKQKNQPHYPENDSNKGAKRKEKTNSNRKKNRPIPSQFSNRMGRKQDVTK